MPNRILQFLLRLRDFFQRDEPPRAVLFCQACGEQIEGEPVSWNGRPFCSFHCVPASDRVAHIKAKAAAYRREADRLDLARKAGL